MLSGAGAGGAAVAAPATSDKGALVGRAPQPVRTAGGGVGAGRAATAIPPGPAVVALANALGVSSDELLGLRATPAAARDPGEQRLWKRCRHMASLPERDQRAVLRLIWSLIGQRKTA